jgi:hypothetical protein
MSQKPIHAIAVFTDSKIKGYVKFTEVLKTNNIAIELNITGLKHNGLHGFHVHELFYALKYKKLFLDLLWIRIREPKIRNKYKPENLIAMLEEKEDITLDELDELLEKW